MRTIPLQFLTWGTITAAIGSAVWLCSADEAAVFYSFGYRSTSQAMDIEIPLPTEATRSGTSGKTSGASAAKQMHARAS